MAECTIYDKLRYIAETKDLIKTAIETQDVEVLESDTFRKYAEYITEIRKVASVNGETGDIILKTINGQNLVGEGNIIIQGGEGGGGITEETDPIFTEWKNGDSIALGKDSTNEGSNNIAIGNTVKVNGEYSIAIGASSIYDDAKYYTEANGSGSIAIGNQTIANNISLAIGTDNNINNASVALGMSNTITSENSLALGNDNKLKDGSFKFAYGYFNEPKNDQEINIGILCDSKTGETDAEKTHFVISSAQNSKCEENTSCFEIRNDDSIYIKMNGQLVKLQDKLNINIPETDLSNYYTKTETYSKDEVDDLLENSGGGVVTETDPIFTSWKNDDSIVAGKNAVNGTTNFGILMEKNNVVVIGNNAKVQVDNGVAIGNGATVLNGAIGGVAIGDNISVDAGYTTNINNVLKGDASKNAYIRNSNGNYVKILDLINNAGGNVDLSDYYTKGEVYNKNEVNELIDGVTAGDVDLTNYYTKQEVDNKIPSLNGYATEQWVEDKNYLTEHQSLENYAKKSDIPDVSEFIKEIPSEYITEEELNGKGYLTSIPDTYVTDGELSTAISDKVSQTALNEAIEGVENKIPSLDGYATEQWVEDKKYLTEHQDLTEYAKKSELPSVEGLASEQWVNQQGFLKEHQSLEDYAKKSDIPTIPTSNTAFTNDAGFITLNEVPETDLSNYYTKEQTYSKDEVDGLLENSGSSTAGVEAINIGRDVQDWTQKTGIVSLYTQMYDGGYEVAADGMSFFGIKPADDTIIIEQGGGTANGCFRGTIRVNPDVLGGGSGNAPTLQEGKSGTTDNYIYSDGDQNSNNCVMASFALRNTASSTSVSIDGDVKLWGDTSFNGKTNTYINGATTTKAGVMTAEDKVNLDALVANSGNTGGSDLISIDANNSSKSLNVGSGNTGDLDGTILVGRDIVNNQNAAVLIGNGVTNTVGDRTNIAVNICNSLMADSSGNMYFWKNGKVEKLADYAVYKEWSGTQAEYNDLGTYDDNTIYNIIEG